MKHPHWLDWVTPQFDSRQGLTGADGSRHRAFSVLIFDSEGRLLVQKRASEKITFPGVWANSCCNCTNYCGRFNWILYFRASRTLFCDLYFNKFEEILFKDNYFIERYLDTDVFKHLIIYNLRGITVSGYDNKLLG